MSKLFKRTMLIALVSIFVLGLSVSASAVTLPIEEDYDYGAYNVCADANITRRSTLGMITVNDATAVNCMVSVSVTYRYIDGNYILQTVSIAKTARGWAMVSYSDSTIHSMVDATYTFYAEIPASYGLQRFTPDPVLLVY